ncbi:MAG: VCBS repeat-containing protein [Clostridia bacterium]|nr:VCBS repeat-containing protein [Clostridia bacterium]
MKIRRITAVFMAACLCVLLTGCKMFSVDTEQLMTPPELTGEMVPISRALSSSIKGEYQLKYPSSGERRSAIILEDIDGDGAVEAFAFYSTQDDETTNMHINAVCKGKSGYKSVAEQSIVAGNVEMVDFCDLDGDGIKEIIVGWEVYGASEKRLCVYSLDRKKLSRRLSEKYTGFACCDLTGSGSFELFIHLLDTSSMINSASLYRFSDGGLQKIGGCILDSEVKTASSPVFSRLSSGRPAVYIDEIKGAGAVTEVLVFGDDELKNPLLETDDTIENIRTLRSASIPCMDIDFDGVPEIPVATNLPNAADTEELLYYTNWCEFDGENLLTKKITVFNTIDGYYLDVPQNLEGHLAVLKDTDNHRRVFYYYDAQSDIIGERLASIEVISEKKWQSKSFDRRNLFELGEDKSVVFVGSVNLTGAVQISQKQLKELFNLIPQEVQK